jgi:hypothetical protein
MGDWVVVLDFVAGGGGQRFSLDSVDRLIERLGEWQPSGLYNPGRYAVQLHLAAPSAEEALRLASLVHANAARGMAVRPLFVRSEVLTLSEFDATWQVGAGPARGEANQEAGTPVEVYDATRALLSAPTSADVADILVNFVVGVGGHVVFGERPPDPNMLMIDLPIGHGEQVCAAAESFSVSGMVIEHWLPRLLDDAQHMMTLLGSAG